MRHRHLLWPRVPTEIRPRRFRGYTGKESGSGCGKHLKNHGAWSLPHRTHWSVRGAPLPATILLVSPVRTSFPSLTLSPHPFCYRPPLLPRQDTLPLLSAPSRQRTHRSRQTNSISRLVVSMSRLNVRAALGGLFMAGAAFLFRPVKPRAPPHTTERGNTLLIANVEEALTVSEIASISKAFGGEMPSGRFLRGRHGLTHFNLQSPDSRSGALKSLDEVAGGGARSRLVVMAHGLGTNMHLYDEVVGVLLDAGYSVLRYDYFGHGWSAADEPYVVYDKTVVLEQLEDLLDHVMGAGSPGSSSPVSIHGFVGHSTGGCVGALATNGLADYRFERLVLVSPCFWKNAPLVSVLCGKAPGLVTLVLRSGKMDFLAQGDYAKNGVIAWMREGGDGAYVYPAAEEKKRLADAAMFKSHPYVSGAIASLDLYILNLALLPSYRDMVREAVGNGSRVSVLWGEGDQTVPYNKNTLEECKGTKAETITLERLGHESIYEDGPRVAAQVLASLSRS